MANLTNELSAVNFILSTVGQQPVHTLDNSRADIRTAQDVLNRTSRVVQAEGWNFNTEYNVTLTRNGDNEIIIPTTAIRIDLNTGSTQDARGVVRGNKLYDTYNHRYTWEKNPVATIVYLLDFSDLPENAKHYIATRSARIYQQEFLGSIEVNQFAIQEETQARASLIRHETNTSDFTIFDGTGVRRLRRNNRFSL